MIKTGLNAWSVYLMLLLIFFMAISVSCKQQSQEKRPSINKKQLKEEFIKSNKNLVSQEAEDIADFLQRYGWKMEETGNGLYYKIYYNGKGSKVKQGDTVALNYKMFFLTGDLVESSEKKGPIEFIAGRGNVISGLNDGVLLLHYGDKAKFIISSHLAYGLIGDKGRIPPKTTLIYDVELIEK